MNSVTTLMTSQGTCPIHCSSTDSNLTCGFTYVALHALAFFCSWTGRLNSVGRLRSDRTKTTSLPHVAVTALFYAPTQVLVTSCDPLRAFIYRDGLVRLGSAPYSPPTAANKDDLFMHLTNYRLVSPLLLCVLPSIFMHSFRSVSFSFFFALSFGNLIVLPVLHAFNPL